MFKWKSNVWKRKKRTHAACNSVANDLWKLKKPRMSWELVLWLAGSSASACDFDNSASACDFVLRTRIVIGRLLCFCVRLRQFNFHLIIHIRVMRAIENQMKPFWFYFFWLRFHRAYDCTSDPDLQINLDSVACVNQPFPCIFLNWGHLDNETNRKVELEQSTTTFSNQATCHVKKQWNLTNFGHC